MNEFTGKKLLVVGGTSGIGLETARQVLESGGSVVLTGSRKEKAEAVRAELSQFGPVSVIAADLMTEQGMNAIREEINANHRDISLMVNSAGIFAPKSFIDHEESDYDMYLSLNRATFFITRDVVRNMQAAGHHGAIVNVGSIGAQAALGGSPASAYSMAKAGLHAFTRNLAIELADSGIRVNAVSPAIVQTSIYEGFMEKEDIADAMKALESFHPLGRVGRPEDVANTIVFLLSEKTSWVTGAIWDVDAGVMAVRS
ncbi:sugar dehydrogenase (plasmid) [Paraburkholderia graminis]|jgi:NAD(P)-dependent dehydrogenase (short-subunit alcohol dehydrogenase family)|uniref:SDR family NAD(P)-dependent oxidoreductase n=1 Tax=Paraburkholderia graminis TaxID=60548 RepID=UPI000DEEE58C|nr:SDR family oxidoreductase [Paraburkholderia graminis]AXF12577.1 sugar dehydrogenase [Paraburkholderia graminis]